MKKDLKISLDSADTPDSYVYDGVHDVLPDMLLQRLVTLMLAGVGAYRGGYQNYDLLSFIDGGNRPPDGVLNAVLAVCCALAVRGLDDSDRALVRAFRGVSVDGKIECTLELSDGIISTGVI